MSIVSGLGKGATLPPRGKMVDYAVKALSDLQEEQYLLGSRLVLTVLHNLLSEPDNERFHHIHTTNPVGSEAASGLGGWGVGGTVRPPLPSSPARLVRCACGAPPPRSCPPSSCLNTPSRLCPRVDHPEPGPAQGRSHVPAGRRFLQRRGAGACRHLDGARAPGRGAQVTRLTRLFPLSAARRVPPDRHDYRQRLDVLYRLHNRGYVGPGGSLVVALRP